MSLTSCFHGMYHLQVVFMACVALRLAAFLALDVFRLVFITCFALIFFVFLSRVSLLGFLSLYSAYPFQAGLFMVFSAPNLVFVVCHFQSSLCNVLLLFIQYIAPPFWDRFSWCIAYFVLMCGASFWSYTSHFLYFEVRVFLYPCSFAYPVVCRVFYSRSLLLTFSFPQVVPVFGNFLLYFFVCSPM